ncbi:bZIP transcription factor 11-like [Andrographis paniculata]|uniref:bZIP transcription factor 11-like n=1 Tax=Andrographis paniculata TaxID=175694 RepID=UPI0021E8824F|nr:bZIP transcription factor 11-like [Andrographis paniculata]
MFFPESPLGSPFQTGFPQWEPFDPPVLFPVDEEPAVFTPQSSTEPVSSNSGSDEPPCDSLTVTPGPDSVSVIDERKRRRMISNRLSARRSRMRKQKHLENLRSLLNGLRFENRERTVRVRFMAQQNLIVRVENEHLRSEAAALRRRLWDIRQVLLVRELQQQLNSSSAIVPLNNNYNGGQFKHHSLIT